MIFGIWMNSSLYYMYCIRVKLMIEILWKLIPANLLSIHFEQSRSFCFQTYKDKELRQIIIMRLKWSDLSLQMTENVGLFVGAQCTSKVTIAPVSIPNPTITVSASSSLCCSTMVHASWHTSHRETSQNSNKSKSVEMKGLKN